MSRVITWGLLLLIIALPRLGRGQSTFVFANFVEGAVDAPVFDAQGNALFGSDYVAMLYGGASPGALMPAVVPFTSDVIDPVTFTFMPNGMVGYFRYTGEQFGFVEIRNVTPGDAAFLQVVVWDSRLGATYEEVVGLGIGGYGQSTVFQKAGGDPTVPTPPEFLIGLQSFSILPVVPEPGTSVLVLLGFSWLLCRRSR